MATSRAIPPPAAVTALARGGTREDAGRSTERERLDGLIESSG
jgi:hypothetical protein